MKPRPLLALILSLTGAAALLLARMPASAAPLGQAAYPSPTPGPDGRIIYIVKAGDTCTQISLLYGVTLDYLRTTNQLDENCTLRDGQPLMLGVGGPSVASPTPGPSPTPTSILPTPTPGAGGTAEVCVLMYDDANGNGLRQETEMGVAGGAISLTSVDGLISRTDITVAQIDPETEDALRICFTNLSPGEYTVSGAPPADFNPTTSLSATIAVIPGDVAFVDFGAQSRTAAGLGGSDGPSPLLGVLGVLFLLGGLGLGVYAWRIMRRK